MPSKPPAPIPPLEDPAPEGVTRVRAKICLVGDPGVGKTSLIARYVRNEFSEEYLTTIGTRVSKKDLEFADPRTGGRVVLNLLIWDIMGQPAFRDLLQEAYFFGATGVLAIADGTRASTVQGLREWIDSVHRVEPGVVVVVGVNKSDLGPTDGFGSGEAAGMARSLGGDVFQTSAKTGAGVEDAFRKLGSLVVTKALHL